MTILVSHQAFTPTFYNKIAPMATHSQLDVATEFGVVSLILLVYKF